MADHRSQTLAPVPHPSHYDHDCPSFSDLFNGVTHSEFPTIQNVGFQVSRNWVSIWVIRTLSSDLFCGFEFFVCVLGGTIWDVPSEVLASVTAKAAQAPVQMDQPVCMHSSTESSSVPKSEISMPNSTPGVENPLALPQDNASIKQRADQKDFSDHKTQLADTVVMNIPNDGYNWRKYGQKQVKSTESSRSYYRCTYSDCDAKKKVQQCHQSGFVTGVIYKGFHNHDPPPKIRCTQLRKSAAVSPVEGSDTNSSNSDSNTGIKAEEESGDVVERKRRMKPQEPQCFHQDGNREVHVVQMRLSKKKLGNVVMNKNLNKGMMKEGGLACSAPLFKTIKEPKIVVHAAGDVGISSDGYRWRKYGQKMVKGNPHPR
ncbi:putative WRKY transcription factor 32 [Vitis vinifera]|uniref:Putative WRKY transcription factor 32 n=1 Tax=Vitis vinifera TaxID=29760 RepID=A0A438CK10_VITVI|nr:putative WRKY transcription factor 32 [Vitis vinifera]